MSGRSEIALNEPGRAEGRRLAARLAGVALGAIHASPRRRAMETAAIVAADHHLPVVPASALDEIDFGEWAGRSFPALDEDPAWVRWNASRATAATPAGETMDRAVDRAIDHLQAVVGDRPLLCVSHCDIIRGIVARVTDHPLDRLFSLPCDPGSLTMIEADGPDLRLVTLNERPR